ncbi:MAG: family 78 glycoside hydrolase catalytic domain [Lentisphaeria bacterium]|nr:family 78 glycoside hydrolase catalytic domain [Lentisphaeria bacterium]
MLTSKPIILSKRPPAHIRRHTDGRVFVAFDKAAFGTIELTLTSQHARNIHVHLGERLQAPHTVDREPPGSIRYRRMTLRVEPGTKTYRLTVTPDDRNTGDKAVLMPPEIGEVMPFRYCEIEGFDGGIAPGDIRQVMAHYPFDDDAAGFNCSDETLNAVWDLCKYSIKATSFCGVYVDGDRERIPYEADAYINQLGHYCVDKEYGMGRATLEHFIDHPTWPTEWSLHMPLMAWAEYIYTGDKAFMDNHYDDLKLRALLKLGREDGLISTQTGLVTPEFVEALRLSQPPRDIVDWPPGSFTEGGTGERDGHEMCPVNTVVNAFHYQALVCMTRIARALGRDGDADVFRRLAVNVAEAVNRNLFDDRRGIYIDGEGAGHASLHANMFPLAFGLVPDDRKPSVTAFVKSRGMACSVYGAHYLLEALYAAGEDDYALSLMTARHDRSWWNMIAVGSTMTLEAWDLRYKNNLDWNHAWGAAPANIIPRHLMGIRPLSPGGDKILIQPRPGSLRHAKIRYPTRHGPMTVEITRGQRSHIDVQVPDGVKATIIPPPGTWSDIFINGKQGQA